MSGFTKRIEILIAGAGIAGCAASQALQAEGADYLLLEKNVEPGGLTRSISVGDAHFDYTGHFLHLARCKTPAGLPFASQRDEDWRLISRKSMVFIEGQLVPAPLQYNLYYLPENIRSLCIDSFHARPVIERPRDFREYLLAGFGESMCRYFLFSYNEKSMACSLENLSLDAVKRFFPEPDAERIQRGAAEEGVNLDAGYNSQFWYPKREGTGLLAKGLASGLRNLRTACPMESIDLARRRVSTPSGEIHYKRLLSSVPLKAFCMLTTDPTLRSLAGSLRHNRVFCLNLLIQGGMPEGFTGCHWVYVPQHEIPFYRLGIYSNIAPGIHPKGSTALYLELAIAHDAPVPVLDRVLDEILSSLERLGWVKRSQCLVMSANWIDCAYVLFDHNHRKTVQEILAILREHEVYPIGRYGLWDYISMEDAILDAVETARMILR